MWGSQGPFPTKAKALQVARAAYASGYKGEQNFAKTWQEQQICAPGKEKPK
jgi:transcriptional regulator GlxA family with amidase domain